ncbi:MAG TPA: hypothetical protein PLK12_03375 [Prolixibacteraceae bacterium]|nr:hypothetical protein [Prolixibacteraceae bacterium]
MNVLSFDQMENIEGNGCSTGATRFIATVGLVAGVGSAFGPIGLLIFGPTALAMGVASVVCAYT